jgi:hypothetical protein
MPEKPSYIVGRLFESRFKGGNAIRQILENPRPTPKLQQRKKRGPTYVNGIHKGNFFRMRLPSKARELPNIPRLPPIQAFPKAPKAMAQQQKQASTDAIMKAVSPGYYNSDFSQRLSKWFQDNWAVLILNAGSICTLVGFTRSDILELRTMSMTGSIASVIYVWGQQKILWPSVVWSSLFAAVNAVKIFEIYQERNSNVHMTKHQEEVYVEYFLPHGITPKQFERVEQKAERFKLKTGEFLTRRYEKLHSVFLVLEGTTIAHILGRYVWL